MCVCSVWFVRSLFLYIWVRFFRVLGRVGFVRAGFVSFVSSLFRDCFSCVVFFS